MTWRRGTKCELCGKEAAAISVLGHQVGKKCAATIDAIERAGGLPEPAVRRPKPRRAARRQPRP